MDITLKLCRKCNIEMDINLFHKDKTKLDGHKNSCKDCQREYSKEFYENNINRERKKSMEYYKLNSGSYEYKSRKNEFNKKYYQNNKVEIKEYNKKYHQDNKEDIREQHREYRENNKDKIKEYRSKNILRRRTTSNQWIKNKLKNDKLFNLSFTLRNLIRISIKKMGYTKKSKTFDIIGCDINFFKSYIESKFEPWMNWENHGKYNGTRDFGWDLDHIIPISSAIDESEVIELNRYTNFQPLCSKVNRDIKRNRLDYDGC